LSWLSCPEGYHALQPVPSMVILRGLHHMLLKSKKAIT
jgi:hypothetical protein